MGRQVPSWCSHLFLSTVISTLQLSLSSQNPTPGCLRFSLKTEENNLEKNPSEKDIRDFCVIILAEKLRFKKKQTFLREDSADLNPVTGIANSIAPKYRALDWDTGIFPARLKSSRQVA